MEINTKFNIGDAVWYYGEDGLKKFVIDEISIIARLKGKSTIVYSNNIPIGRAGDKIELPEEKLFPSKEELIKTL